MSSFFENIGTVVSGINAISHDTNVQDKPDHNKLTQVLGAICFDDIKFQYNNGKKVFDKFQLNIAAGKKIGIIGRSGFGKSTLVNLLLRFYNLNSGKITIDGQDISRITKAKYWYGYARYFFAA